MLQFRKPLSGVDTDKRLQKVNICEQMEYVSLHLHLKYLKTNQYQLEDVVVTEWVSTTMAEIKWISGGKKKKGNFRWPLTSIEG